MPKKSRAPKVEERSNPTDQKRYVNIKEELTPDEQKKKQLAFIIVIVLSLVIASLWLWTLSHNIDVVQKQNQDQELTQEFKQAMTEITKAVDTIKSKVSTSSTVSTTLSQADMEKLKTDVLSNLKDNLDESSWPQHISEAIGLSLQYPLGWQKKEIKNELIFNDVATGTTATLDIKKFANDKGVTLANWLTTKTNKTAYAGYRLSTSSTLDNITFLKYNSSTTDQTINSLIVVAHDKYVYEISLIAKNGSDLYDSIFNKIITTIKFLNLK
jgi:hypothetical protein